MENNNGWLKEWGRSILSSIEDSRKDIKDTRLELKGEIEGLRSKVNVLNTNFATFKKETKMKVGLYGIIAGLITAIPTAVAIAAITVKIMMGVP